MKQFAIAAAIMLILWLAISMLFVSASETNVLPCTTDTDCHEKNPGLCKPEEPYCF